MMDDTSRSRGDAQKPPSRSTEFETAAETVGAGRRLTLEGVLAGWGCVVVPSGPGFSVYVPEVDGRLLERLDTFGFELDMIRSVYESELHREGVDAQMVVLHLHDVLQGETHRIFDTPIDAIDSSVE